MSKKILLVDDDQGFLDISKRFLSHIDNEFEITTIASPTDVFNELDNNSFEVIVSDYQMPELTGLDILSQLRKMNNDIPFIIFTGKSREEIAIKSLNLGADYYLMKGGDPETQYAELAHIIHKVTHYKQIEFDLKKSERKAHALLEALPDLMFCLNKDGIYLSVYGPPELLYAPLETLLGKKLSEILPQEVALIGYMNIEKSLSLKKRQIFQYKLQIDGIYHLFECRMVPLNDEEVLAIVRDMTEWEKMESALMESEMQFKAIFEEANDGFLLADPQTKKFVLANKKICQMLGYTLEEIKNLSVYEIHPKESVQLVIEQFEKLYREEIDIAYDLAVRRKDGSIFYADISSRPVAINQKKFLLGIFRDISKQKTIKEAIQVEEDRLRQIAENTLEWIWEVDINGLYTYVSPGIEKILGYEAHEIKNKLHFYDLFHPQDYEALKEAAFKIFAEKKTFHDFPNRNITKNGKIVWFSTSGVPILNEKGDLIGYRGADTDITQKKLFEEKLVLQKEELSEFAHLISHDIINSINTIKGYNSLLKKNYDKDILDKIDQMLENLNNLVKHSLSLAEMGLRVKKTDYINLTDIVKTIAEQTIPKDIKFVMEPLPMISGDYEKIKSVFVNLFDNAVVHGKPNEIEVKKIDSKTGITILIINDGVPIPKEHRTLIFQQGFTTKEEGHGLGLSLIKRIILAHGWQIKLETEQKTTFSIFIPYNDINQK